MLQPRKALPFFSRHPWVFRGAVDRIVGEPAAGDIVALHAHDGVFIAWGLFNPASNIGVRLYSWDESVRLNDEFWRQRIDDAISLRRTLIPEFTPTSACRLVFSEADGLSGLTVDRYGDWLLVQMTSFALAQRQEVLLQRLRETLNPRGIWLRTEKGIRARKDWNSLTDCCGARLHRVRCSSKSTESVTESMWQKARRRDSFSINVRIVAGQRIS